MAELFGWGKVIKLKIIEKVIFIGKLWEKNYTALLLK